MMPPVIILTHFGLASTTGTSASNPVSCQHTDVPRVGDAHDGHANQVAAVPLAPPPTRDVPASPYVIALTQMLENRDCKPTGRFKVGSLDVEIRNADTSLWIIVR